MASNKKNNEICIFTRGQDGVSVPPTAPDELPHVGHDDVLHQDEYGGDFVRKHVRIGGSRQPLACHRNEIQTAR